MWTGIPVRRLAEEETQKLLKMEETLHAKVIGQETAVTTISRAVRRARAGLKDPRRPIGVFFFVGPTGTGKTHLARQLAEFMFGSQDNVVKIDMSDYMERHNVSRLVGSPPGYVGYEEGGQLTETVRRKSYCVILLDEIEKAHPEVFNILLQIFDEGRLSDAKGRTVDFRNTIIIMTSNLAQKMLKSEGALGFRSKGTGDDPETQAAYEHMKERVNDEMKRFFRPEFLNRIDATVVFQPLTKPEIRKIVEIELGGVRKQPASQAMSFIVTDEAKDYIATVGWNTLVEERVVAPQKGRVGPARAPRAPVALDQVPPDAEVRIPTGIGEFDRVLGGGIVRGSLVLLGGDPGIGKSSLLMQASASLSSRGAVLYVTGEESAAQVKMRARRFGIEGGNILVLAETDLGSVIEAIRRG